MRYVEKSGCWVLLALLSLALLACGSSDKNEPVVGDGDTDSEIALDGDGENDLVNEGDSEPEGSGVDLRLYQIPADGKSPLTGPAAVGMGGDYVLENAKARFLIQGSGRARSWVPYGGSLVDADLKRADGEAGKDILNEVSIITGTIRGFKPESFEIVKGRLGRQRGRPARQRPRRRHSGGRYGAVRSSPSTPRSFWNTNLLPGETALKLTTYYTASARGPVRLGRRRGLGSPHPGPDSRRGLGHGQTDRRRVQRTVRHHPRFGLRLQPRRRHPDRLDLQRQHGALHGLL